MLFVFLGVLLIVIFFFFLLIRQSPRSTLFPYTTLFRSTTANTSLMLVSPDMSELTSRSWSACAARGELGQDRKSTRLNSSHTVISYAVFCLKKKKKSVDELQP